MKFLSLFPLLVLFIISTKNLNAQQNNSLSLLDSTNSTNYNLTGVSSYSSQKQPQSININNTAIIAATTVVATGLLLLTDKTTYEAVDNIPSHTFLGKINPYLTEMGHGVFSLGLLGCFGIHHLVTKESKSWEVVKLGLESFILSGVTTQLLKNTFSRERPSHQTEPIGKWYGPFAQFLNKNKGKSIANFDAFPSGHTATAFSTATVLAHVYPDGAVPYIAYSLAGIVAVTRVTEKTHWFSDCFLGMVIGYYSAKAVISFNEPDQKISSSFGILINGGWINLQYKL